MANWSRQPSPIPNRSYPSSEARQTTQCDGLSHQWKLDGHRGKAAVYLQDRPGDKRGRLLRRQVHRRSHQFATLPEAVHGRMSEDAGHAILSEQFAVLLGREESRQNGVHADIVARQFARQELGDQVNARLGYGVREYLRERRSGRSRRDIYDGAPLAGIDHALAEYPARRKHAGPARIQASPPLAFRIL